MDNCPNGQFNNGSGEWNIQNPLPPLYYPVMPSPEEEQRISDKKVLKTLGTAFGISVIIYIVLSNSLAAVLLLVAKLFPAVKTALLDSTGEIAVSSMLSELVLFCSFLGSYIFLRAKKYTGILPFGTTYNRKAATSLVMLSAPVVLVTTIIINIISSIIQAALDTKFESGLEGLTADGPVGAVVMVFALSVLPAIIEEFCIRGVVLQPLRRYGDKFAIVVSAAVFSLLHGNMAQIPYTFPAGLVFGYVCVATGSLWPSIILHFINNMFSTVQVIISSNFGDTAGAASIFVMLALLVAAGIFGGVKYFGMNYKADLKKGVGTLKTGTKVSAFLVNPAAITALVIIFVMVIIQLI